MYVCMYIRVYVTYLQLACSNFEGQGVDLEPLSAGQGVAVTAFQVHLVELQQLCVAQTKPSVRVEGHVSLHTAIYCITTYIHTYTYIHTVHILRK